MLQKLQIATVRNVFHKIEASSDSTERLILCEKLTITIFLKGLYSHAYFAFVVSSFSHQPITCRKLLEVEFRIHRCFLRDMQIFSRN